MNRWISVALVASVCGSPLWAQQSLKVAYLDGATTAHAAVKALYKEVGLVPEFVLLPAERALKSLEAGEVDADLGRVMGGTAAYKNMVECAEPFSEINLLAVVKKGSPITKVSLADLKTYKLGYVRGTKIAEGVLAKAGVEGAQTNDVKQLVQVIGGDRIDIGLTTSSAPVPADAAAAVTTLAQPLMTAKVVHVLGHKWASYCPKLDAALKTMKADGRWAKLLAPAR